MVSFVMLLKDEIPYRVPVLSVALAEANDFPTGRA
jgi:hypothetical protein